MVIYLIFNEGYAATFGDGLIRDDLCAEAIRLGRVLCELMPGEDENRGLLALMLLQDSRKAARTGPSGELITLEFQDRALWDRAQIRSAQALLRAGDAGRYGIEASIALEHAVAPTPADTDWHRVARLYALLARLHPSPVVELNRAAAVAMAEGCEAGLALMDTIPGLGDFHLFHAARADLLRRLDRNPDAVEAYRRALELVTNPVERTYLEGRLAAIERKMESWCVLKDAMFSRMKDPSG
jgi:RNA polymerase sigma-70 factor (ECF subfamily)